MFPTLVLCGAAALAYLPAQAAPPDPRGTAVIPYRNVLPGVGYVGDEACAACHARHAASYRRHPMGRSLTPEAELVGQEPLGSEAHNPFETAGFQFRVERRDGRLFHQTVRRDPQGAVVCAREAEVRFAIGAGRRGRSYLIDRDGYLFQSPISWYTQRQAWDLSPHLAGSPGQLYRPVQVQCLFCHANHANAVPDTGNRYREPIFRGSSIGCERCHGPGQLHVARYASSEPGREPDNTIVNPGRLEPALRDAVCEQCHLQGVARILRPGRQPFDYRPGLPLERFWSVFVRAGSAADDRKFSSHVEQLAASRCSTASGGKLGCIACHDPHRLPAAAETAAYYRHRCLACHDAKTCAGPAAARQETTPADNCISCHMPRSEVSNLAHMAATDHRIPRRADASPRPQPPAGQPPRYPVTLFHPGLAGADNPGAGRDLGIALVDLAGLKQPEARRVQLAEQALPLLRDARAKDVAAGQARGYALWLLGRRQEAWDVFQAALAQAPEREELLSYAAACAAQLGRPADAADLWRRALRVDPWAVRPHQELARLLARSRDWREASEQCQAALRLDPFRPEARLLLVRCSLRLGDGERARAELERLVGLNPRQEIELRRWFAGEARAAGTPP